MLWFIENSGVIKFTSDVNGDILKLTTTLPFVALYILVFIGATAGFARSAIVAKELPFSKILDQELKRKTMKSATIMTKIRSGATITQDTPYLHAVDRLIAARVPILAIVGEGNKVGGVVTYYDIVKQLQLEMEKNPNFSKVQIYVSFIVTSIFIFYLVPFFITNFCSYYPDLCYSFGRAVYTIVPTTEWIVHFGILFWGLFNSSYFLFKKI